MILETWKGIIEDFAETERCGLCWKFYAPMTEIDLNLIRGDRDTECCVHVFLKRNKGIDFQERINYTDYGTIKDVAKLEMYDVAFLIKSKEGINNYNEMPGHDVDESRYATIFKPLRDCITNDIISSICEIGRISSWTGKYIYDYQDEMYYGIEMSITQEIKVL